MNGKGIMTYEETCRNIIREYRTKNLAAKQRAEERRRELDEKYPDIAKIDEALLDTGLKILRAALEGPDGLDERIKKLQSDNERLLFDRARLLESKGYPSDYDDVHYDCPVCSDTGYAKDGKMCRCMKKALAEAGLECSGVKKLVEKQNFSTFDLRYYTGSAHESMEGVLRICRAYADGFDGRMHNLLFIGKTGLGKTHLSSAIAKEVIEKGYEVVYESAQNIFSDFEKEKFSRFDVTPPDTSRYYNCDLLIIDDLGTEMPSQLTVACLYNLLNARLVNEKSMIISTNVGKNELLERYSERITSRLLGEFGICVFEGSDVRSQKLRR